MLGKLAARFPNTLNPRWNLYHLSLISLSHHRGAARRLRRLSVHSYSQFTLRRDLQLVRGIK